MMTKTFDNIISFFTLHFLTLDHSRGAYAWIKEHTNSGGLNVFRDFTNIGSLNTLNGFYFEKDELKHSYKGWEILTYNESLGQTKSGGNHTIASIVARKP